MRMRVLTAKHLTIFQTKLRGPNKTRRFHKH
jgi:hypothetical protein